MESNSELLGCVQYVLRPDSVPTSRRTALALQTGVSQASRDDELPNTEDSTVDGITQPTSLCNPEGDSPYYIVLSLGL